MIILENDSYLPADIPKVEILEVTPIKEDRPRGWLNQAGKQLDESSLAASTPADDGDDLAGNKLDTNAFQNVGRFGTAVFKANAA